MKIEIKTIPHQVQRYNTCGDYWIDKDGTIQFRVSEMNNYVFEWLILIHEMVEFFLCLVKKVPLDKIDKFDLSFKDKGEPGDDRLAPYRNEHCVATGVERLMCGIVGVPWVDYNNAVNGLVYTKHGEKYFKNRISSVD